MPLIFNLNDNSDKLKVVRVNSDNNKIVVYKNSF